MKNKFGMLAALALSLAVTGAAFAAPAGTTKKTAKPALVETTKTTNHRKAKKRHHNKAVQKTTGMTSKKSGQK